VIEKDKNAGMALPVEIILPQLEMALADHGSAVLIAPPGSGKTTRVPLALQDAPWLGGKKILVLEPRRIAARLAANYMSGLLGETVGGTVGYQVRFDRKISAGTRIEIITEGLLTRRLQRDPELADVGLVIFDEFHERSLDLDLALGLCLDVISGLREDLRLLVMSATMDAGPVSRLLNDAPIITGEGRLYPVKVKHLPPLPQFDSSRSDHLARTTTQAIQQVLADERGDMLVFLPGIGEINRVQRLLGHMEGVVVRPLHGSLKPVEQERAIKPDPAGKQRIILATTIAETSVTIEGITVVIDCGWKRVPRFNANSGLTGLDTVRISKASAAQRAGRAGRLASGTCYRLWNKGVDAGLKAFDLPEIRQADLASLVLELANWGVPDPAQLSWLDPPPESSFHQAKELLVRLGAIDPQGLITNSGREMGKLPLHPRLARMVILSSEENKKEAVDLAALLSERDLLPKSDSADVENRLHCLRRFRKQGIAVVRAMDGHSGGCIQADRVSRQLSAMLKKNYRASRVKPLPDKTYQSNQVSANQVPANQVPDSGRHRNDDNVDVSTLSIGGLLALAYPDRIAKRRTGKGRSYKLASGQGGRLREHDPLAAYEWLVVASQDVRSRDGHIYLAAVIEIDEILELFDPEISETEEVVWDSNTQSVVSRLRTYLGGLIITEKRITNPSPEAIQKALMMGIREQGLNSLPWTKDARLLQTRIGCLGGWQPDANWPDLSDEALQNSLEAWLSPYLQGMKNIKGCNQLNLKKILLARLDYKQRRGLESKAPTHVQVPSGSKIKLQYQVGKPPILAVRLQEMFGQDETPTVCHGKVRVLLHLLSPAGRPVQVTQDLRGFWDKIYFEVRKELKGRYPKHHWPEHPWKATATAKVKRRGHGRK